MRRNDINKLGVPIIDMWEDTCREADKQVDWEVRDHIAEQWREQCPFIAEHVIDQVGEIDDLSRNRK